MPDEYVPRWPLSDKPRSIPWPIWDDIVDAHPITIHRRFVAAMGGLVDWERCETCEEDFQPDQGQMHRVTEALLAKVKGKPLQPVDGKIARAFGLKVVEPVVDHYVLVRVTESTRTVDQWQDLIHDALCACGNDPSRDCDVLDVQLGDG